MHSWEDQMRRKVLLRIHRRTPIQSTDFNSGPQLGLRRCIHELEKLRRLVRAAEQYSETSHNDNTRRSATTAISDSDFGDSVWFGG